PSPVPSASPPRRSSDLLGGLGGGGLSLGVNTGQYLASQNSAAVAFDDFTQDPGCRCRYFEHHLVGFNLDQNLVCFDRLAWLLFPDRKSTRLNSSHVSNS